MIFLLTIISILKLTSVFGIQTPIDIPILLKRIDCKRNILKKRSKERRNLNFYVLDDDKESKTYLKNHVKSKPKWLQKPEISGCENAHY